VSRFSFETVVRGASAIVLLRGELDLPATAELEPELARLAEEPGLETLTLDLRSLDFLDSRGLQAFVLAERLLDENERRLVIVRGTSLVQRVFELTRMTERIEFVDAVS
jgi:anti-anti-sigma factor